MAGPRSFEPSERLPPGVALSTTRGERVPPSDAFAARASGRSLKHAPNAVRRPPRQGRPPSATLRAPSIDECHADQLAPAQDPPPDRGFATRTRLPTLIHPASVEERLDGRYRGLITRGRSRHASLVDFCNQCDPQARAAGSVETLLPARVNRSLVRRKPGARPSRGGAAEMRRR